MLGALIAGLSAAPLLPDAGDVVSAPLVAHADVTKSEVDFAEASARVAAARVVKLETERDGAWQATRRSLATETAQGDQSLNLLSNATRRFEAIAQTVAAARAETVAQRKLAALTAAAYRAQGTLREAERSAAASAAKAEQDRIGLEAARRADADAFRRYQAEKPVKPPELTVAERTRLLSAQAESAEMLANATVLADVE